MGCRSLGGGRGAGDASKNGFRRRLGLLSVIDLDKISSLSSHGLLEALKFSGIQTRGLNDCIEGHTGSEQITSDGTSCSFIPKLEALGLDFIVDGQDLLQRARIRNSSHGFFDFFTFFSTVTPRVRRTTPKRLKIT